MPTRRSQGFCTPWNRFKRDSLYVTVSVAEALQEVAVAAFFLAADDSSYITGVDLPVRTDLKLP